MTDPNDLPGLGVDRHILVTHLATQYIPTPDWPPMYNWDIHQSAVGLSCRPRV